MLAVQRADLPIPAVSRGACDIPSTAHSLGAIRAGQRIAPMATMEMLGKLPALDDDLDVNQFLEHDVPRDNERNLKFQGVLLGSAAPARDIEGRWMELRIYKTAGGKYVFSRIGRSINPDERDKAEAEIFDPNAPWRKVGDSGWQDAAQQFFRYSELAKQLYRKLELDASERID